MIEWQKLRRIQERNETKLKLFGQSNKYDQEFWTHLLTYYHSLQTDEIDNWTEEEVEYLR